VRWGGHVVKARRQTRRLNPCPNLEGNFFTRRIAVYIVLPTRFLPFSDGLALLCLPHASGISMSAEHTNAQTSAQNAAKKRTSSQRNVLILTFPARIPGFTPHLALFLTQKYAI
jgi:hypothetical protein